MRKNRYNFDALQDQHLDAMIRLAYKQADALESQRIAEGYYASPAQPSPDAAAAAFASFEDKLRQRSRQDGKAARRRRLGHMIPRIVQAAACIVLVLGISAPIAIANVESIRVKVMELLVDIQEDHAELEMVENNDLDLLIPAGWAGDYYPLYIPDGFTVTDVGSLFATINFTSSDGRNIRFTELTADDQTNIDSDDARLSYTTFNGENAFIVEKDDSITVAWGVNDRYFVLNADTTEEEALEIAKNVRRIK